MSQRLNRRRYAEVVRFLKSVLEDPKASLRMKMQAACRLDDLFARTEQAEQIAERGRVRKTGAHERTGTMTETATATAHATVPEEDPDAHMRQLMESILSHRQSADG